MWRCVGASALDTHIAPSHSLRVVRDSHPAYTLANRIESNNYITLNTVSNASMKTARRPGEYLTQSGLPPILSTVLIFRRIWLLAVEKVHSGQYTR